MKQHRKRNHPTKVAGTCRWSDDTCWYEHIHEENSHPENKKNDHQILPPIQPPNDLTRMTEALEGPDNKTDDGNWTKKKWMWNWKHRKHENSENKSPRVTCRSCGFTTMSSRTLDNHISACHNGNSWPCRLCENTTSIIYWMIRHIQSIHQGWSYQYT